MNQCSKCNNESVIIQNWLAIDKGANAIVAVRFNDVSMEGKDRQMALVSVHGTAVKIS